MELSPSWDTIEECYALHGRSVCDGVDYDRQTAFQKSMKAALAARLAQIGRETGSAAAYAATLATVAGQCPAGTQRGRDGKCITPAPPPPPVVHAPCPPGDVRIPDGSGRCFTPGRTGRYEATLAQRFVDPCPAGLERDSKNRCVPTRTGPAIHPPAPAATISKAKTMQSIPTELRPARFWGGVLDIVTGIIPGTLDDKAVEAGRTILRGRVPRTRPTGGPSIPLTTGGGRGFAPATCGPGYTFRDGRCEEEGISGTVHRALPGGDTGIQADAVSEILGVTGREPVVTGRRTCGAGYRLASNGLCYPTSFLPAKFRAYAKHKAPVSWRDMQIAKTAGRVARAIDRANEQLSKAGMKKNR